MENFVKENFREGALPCGRTFLKENFCEGALPSTEKKVFYTNKVIC